MTNTISNQKTHALANELAQWLPLGAAFTVLLLLGMIGRGLRAAEDNITHPDINFRVLATGSIYKNTMKVTTDTGTMKVRSGQTISIRDLEPGNFYQMSWDGQSGTYELAVELKKLDLSTDSNNPNKTVNVINRKPIPGTIYDKVFYEHGSKNLDKGFGYSKRVDLDKLKITPGGRLSYAIPTP